VYTARIRSHESPERCLSVLAADHHQRDFLREQGRPVYDETILKARDPGEGARDRDDEDDPVHDQAVELVARMEEVSVSKLQREMRLGYDEAAKIIERRYCTIAARVNALSCSFPSGMTLSESTHP